MQQINIYPPSTCLEIWLNEPRRAQNSQAPANLLRLWFPESIMAFDVREICSGSRLTNTLGLPGAMKIWLSEI